MNPSLAKTTFGATLFISGCCIGAGMIGLPVMSVFAGFVPATIAMLFCYLFTTATGLLLLEATLWFDHEVNLLTIVEFALGKIGKILTLVLFLSLFYCIFVAYLDGGGLLFASLLSSILQHPVSREIGVLTCVFCVGTLTFAGTQIVDKINSRLIIGLIISYVALVMIGLPKIQLANLQHVNVRATFATIPILLICFGYHNLVPSLVYYLKKNVLALRLAIIIGNLIPLFIYLLWNLVILGLLPATDQYKGNAVLMITELLQNNATYLSVLFLIHAFSFFAILTSFLPSALSFVDFLRDGIEKLAKKTTYNRIILSAFVFIPPLVCTLLYPHLFLQALGFAGGFIDVLLFALLPALVILIGRYFKKVSGPYQIMGGVVTPVVILILAIALLTMKIAP